MGKALPAALLLFSLTAAAGAQAPRIDTLTPAQGPIAGATVVTVSGAGFVGATVELDGLPVVPSAQSATQIQFTTPARDNGYALVKVTTAGGSAYAEFLYVPPKLEDLPPGSITTVAGVGLYSRFYLPATTASINAFGISSDAAGNIYVAGPNEHRVVRIRTDGILEPFAGNGTYDVGDGGPATKTGIIFPRTCVLDATGNAYIPDEGNRIRRVDAKTGIITTIAGTGVAGFSGDGGPATAAQIHNPTYLAVAPGGTLYFIDFRNARIRRIRPDGTIDTIAGNGTSGSSGDGGPATGAEIEHIFNDYGGLALDPGKHLYVVEQFGGKVRRIDLETGIISTVLPRPSQPPLIRPWGITVDDSGNVFVGMEGRVVKYSRLGQVLDSWGDGILGVSEDGTPIDQVRFVLPSSLALDPAGNLLFTDQAVARVRRINLQTGLLETVAGIAPRALGVPGPAVGAVLPGEVGDLMFLPSRDLLLTDGISLWIFKIDRRGQISTFGGTGLGGFGPGPGDGRHISAVGAAPAAMVSDGRGGFYMCCEGPVHYVDPGGFTHHVAGEGDRGYSGDGGPATHAHLTQPWDIALDRDGNLFIADTNNNRIRRVEKATGIIITAAGGGPLNGFEGYCRGSYFCGDGGAALEACLNTPFGVAVDPDGNLFIGDTCNDRIRKVSTTGIINTFSDMTGVGSISKLVADSHGGLFVHAGARVWRFLPDGSSWPVAGTGETGFAGDGGPATSAKMLGAGWSAGAIDTDSEGNLFFHDSMNRRFRAVRFGAVLAPPDPEVQATLGGGQSAPVSNAFGPPLEVTVKTAWGSPAPGVRVDFAAPASAASCVFANGKSTISVLTDRSGRAQAACTATCQTGSYQVTATPLGSAKTVSFSLTNTPATAESRAQATLLCLDDQPGDQRFQAKINWHTTQAGGLDGAGHALSLAELGVAHGGLFWFFSQSNPELLLKVLNGCGVNSKFWVFFSAGTNVGLDVTVTDTQTGAQRTYTNPDLTPAAPVQDTAAFSCPVSDLGIASRAAPDLRPPQKENPPPTSWAADGAGCVTGDTTLCIASRFRVTVDYATVQAGGLAGRAHTIPLTSLGVGDGGLFWFFAPDNPEMLLKVLDGCAVNQKRWVFYSAGTNLGLTVAVTDTLTGLTRTYTNPDLTAAPPVQDVGAFPCEAV
ncbi:MAG TPA: IPT/TIG domain-containing protein [Thermoanaerobaculia bacterium]